MVFNKFSTAVLEQSNVYRLIQRQKTRIKFIDENQIWNKITLTLHALLAGVERADKSGQKCFHI